MIEKQKTFVYEYFGRTELGRAMIASNSISDSDLLFLIPNNVKKMHGLPVTRMSGKKKRKRKNQRKKFIMSFKLFDLIEEIVERTIGSKFSQNEFFNQFVDVKNLSIGDKHEFTVNPFDESKIVTIPISAKTIKMYIDKR